MKIRALEKAKLDSHATTGILRPLTATHLLAVGVDLWKIQAALGHDSRKLQKSIPA
jgi:site-specific recombinase XerD